MDRPLPIVLLHGMRVSHTMWAPLRHRLRRDRLGRTRSLAAPDLPGHGARAGQDFSLDAAVAACRAALEEVGGRALVVGHSLGGFVAFAAAQAAPAQVAGVVAIGASTRPSGVGLAAYRAYAHLLASDPSRGARMTSALARRALPGPEFEAWTSGGYTNERAPGVVAALAGSDPVEAVRAYGGPVWLVNGSLDQLRLGEREFSRLPNVRLSVWPGLNHLSVIGQSDRLVTAIEDAAVVAATEAPIR